VNNSSKKPIVLSLSGHDPSGGAGIQADIETFIHHGCHPCTVITCLTVQDSNTVHKVMPLNADDIVEQANTLFADMPIAAIKIGLTGSVECIQAIESILLQHPHVPVILDPVLACGDGTPLANTRLITAIKEKLMPLTTIVTPNSLEACKLTGLSKQAKVEHLGQALLELGTEYALITGGHIAGEYIHNHLFHKNTPTTSKQWLRKAGEFHGTGCTLASAITALIVQGNNIPTAIEQAQEYTDTCIQNAEQLGKGQLFPRRTQ